MFISGTRKGGLKARESNLKNDPNFYKKIGALGGMAGKGPDYKGGFAADHERAVAAGRLGGLKSSRKGVKNGEGKKRGAYVIQEEA